LSLPCFPYDISRFCNGDHHFLIECDNLVERVADFSANTDLVKGHAYRKKFPFFISFSTRNNSVLSSTSTNWSSEWIGDPLPFSAPFDLKIFLALHQKPTLRGNWVVFFVHAD
jgi:hypothetical protein